MESDTLFVLGAYRGWPLYASDGTPTEMKPGWGEAVPGERMMGQRRPERAGAGSLY